MRKFFGVPSVNEPWLIGLARQSAAGITVGLSAVIYAISYGAMLFSGPLAPYVGIGIAAAIVTAVIGALFGLLSEERRFISGPDSSTTSVLAGLLATLSAMQSAELRTVNLALATLFLTSVVCAVAFYALGRFKLAGLVRFMPFSVTAGFLASNGWLICSSGLDIITGTPLSRSGLAALLAHPYRPELGLALAVLLALYGLASRVSAALLIPLVMLTASLLVNVALASGICPATVCNRDSWMFHGLDDLLWRPPWTLSLAWLDWRTLVAELPSMLVISFVGTLVILVSLASLERDFKKEFDLDRLLKAHAASTGLSAMLGGFVGIVSIGRTSLNRTVGGGAMSGVIASVICLAMLVGASGLIAYVPKAALGALVMFLGLNMLKKWLWDQITAVNWHELAQIVLIVVLVANYGYLIGFAAGTVISCIVFAVAYSHIPLANLTTDLSALPSSVVRARQEVEVLSARASKTVVYRFEGYIFFGSAKKIDAVFQAMKMDALEAIVMDFTLVNGIDRSAISAFQRILRRYADLPLHFYFVHPATDWALQQSLLDDGSLAGQVSFLQVLDLALEAAEERILSSSLVAGHAPGCFDFLDNSDDREVFRSYCDLRRFESGDMLCHEGELSDAVYFVNSGTFDVTQPVDSKPGRRLAKIRLGAMVGEMALYTGKARTASIQATVTSSAFILSKLALARMRIEAPELVTRFEHMVIRKVSESLARSNQLVATLR
jgi:sulfate permease, SulP family